MLAQPFRARIRYTGFSVSGETATSAPEASIAVVR